MQHRGGMSDMSLVGESVNDMTAHSGGPGDASISGISFAGQTPGTHIDVDEVCLVKRKEQVSMTKIKQWLVSMLKKMDLQFSEHPPEYWETLRRNIRRCVGEEEYQCCLLQEFIQGVVCEVEDFECTEAMERWSKASVTNADELIQLLSAFQQSLERMGIAVEGLSQSSVGESDESVGPKKKRRRERTEAEAAAGSNTLQHAMKGKGKGRATKALREVSQEGVFTGHTKKRKKCKVREKDESRGVMKRKRREDRYLVLKQDVGMGEGDDEENYDPKWKANAGRTPHPDRAGLSARRRTEERRSLGQTFEGFGNRRGLAEENGGNVGHRSFPDSASSSASIRKPLRARNYRDAPDDTPWRCVSCDRGFKSRNALEAHIRVSPVHAGKDNPTPPASASPGCGELARQGEGSGNPLERSDGRDVECVEGDDLAVESSQEEQVAREEHPPASAARGEARAPAASGRDDGSQEAFKGEQEAGAEKEESAQKKKPGALEREELSTLMQELLSELQSEREERGLPEEAAAAAGGEGGQGRYPWGGACAHCTEPYALDGAHLPKLLPCFHTVCAGCAGAAGRCPWCKTEEGCGGCERLPLNPLEVDRLLRRCGECGEGVPAIASCEECEKVLCHRCRELHTRTPMFKRHALAALPQAAFVPRERCAGEGHGEAALEIYCKSCERLFCSKGFLKEHSAEMHEFTWIQKMAPDSAAERVAALQQQLGGARARVAGRCEQAVAGLAHMGEDRGQLARQLDSLIEAAQRLKTDTLAVYDETRRGETDRWAAEYQQCRTEGARLRQAVGFSAALAARAAQSSSSVHDYQINQSAQELLGQYLGDAEQEQRSEGSGGVTGRLVSSVAFSAFRERLQHLNTVSAELVANLASRTAGSVEGVAGEGEGEAPEQLRDRLLRFRRLLRPRPQTDEGGKLQLAGGSEGGARLMGQDVSRVEQSVDHSMATACNVVLSTWHHLSPGIARGGQG